MGKIIYIILYLSSSGSIIHPIISSIRSFHGIDLKRERVSRVQKNILHKNLSDLRVNQNIKGENEGGHYGVMVQLSGRGRPELKSMSKKLTIEKLKTPTKCGDCEEI